MARPKKADSNLKNKKVVVYVDEETKQKLQEAVGTLESSSESKIGDQAIREWLESSKGGSKVEYSMSKSNFDTTGPVDSDLLIFEKPVDVPFSAKFDDETWSGSVTSFVDHGSHVEFSVSARQSSFRVIAGKTVSGWFLAVPSDKAFLSIGYPDDFSYNKEKVFQCPHLNTVDGISSVMALGALYKDGYLKE